MAKFIQILNMQKDNRIEWVNADSIERVYEATEEDGKGGFSGTIIHFAKDHFLRSSTPFADVQEMLRNA